MTATKKRFLAALFAALMSLGVVACNGGTDGGTDNGGDTGTEDTGTEDTGTELDGS